MTDPDFYILEPDLVDDYNGWRSELVQAVVFGGTVLWTILLASLVWPIIVGVG